MRTIILLLCCFLFSVASAQTVSPKTKRDKVGFFDGREQVIDYVYDEVLSKYKGAYAVRRGGYWGVVDEFGKEIIPCTYDLLRYNGGGYIVSTGGKYGVIDKSGNELTKIIYENIDHNYQDSVALVKLDGEWGYTIGPEKIFISDTSVVFKRPAQMPLFFNCPNVGPYPDRIKSCSETLMLTYIFEHLTYPQAARDNGISGMAVIGFVVEASGEIGEARIVRDVAGGCGAEALRMVKDMDAWHPAQQDGNAVAAWFYLPVKFVLE